MTQTHTGSTEATASLSDRLAARRRARLTRILVIAGSAAVIIGLLAAAWFSPVLAITSVKAKATEFYTAEQIEEAVLADWSGTPLPQAMPGTVEKAALKRLPKAASAKARWAGPRALSVTVTDRTPLIAVRAGSGWDRVDATGTTIDTVTGEPDGLARLELTAGAGRKETISAALALLDELPDGVLEQISVVRASDPEKIEIDYSPGEDASPVTIRFGSAEDAARKFDIASKLIDTDAQTIDVSVPEVPVTS